MASERNLGLAALSIRSLIMKRLAAGIFLYCWSVSAFAQGVNFYSPQEEVRIGRQQAAILARTLPVVHEAILHAYVASVGSALAAHAGQAFTYSFTLYEDRETPGLPPIEFVMPEDAFEGPATEPAALPGGPIFIPLSLLANAQDEAELAFQLAHAMAHITLRHATRQATREQLIQGTISPRPVAQTAFLSFTRRDELQADATAVATMAAAGYDPKAAIRHLEKLTTEKKEASRFFSSYPAPARRVATVRAAIDKLP